MLKYIREYEKMYMYRITEPQIFHLGVVDFLCVIYGIFGYVFLSKIVFKDVYYGQLVYSLYLICCLILTVYILCGKLFTRKENKASRYKFCNGGMVLVTQLYFIWSYIEIYLTYIDGGRLDYMPWIFVYIVCVTSFFYRHNDFLILSAINIAMALFIGLKLYGGINEMVSQIYALILMPLLVVIYVSKHITELRAFERTLDYEKSVEVKNLFRASMNHELRTPLNSVIGNAQILLSDKVLNNNQREIADNIFNSSKIMVQLVNDLLDYSKLEAGEFKIIQNDFSLLDLKDTVEIMMRPLANAKNLDFSMVIEEGTPLELHGDRNRIQQIMINIISNGIKYTKAGSVKTSLSYTDNKLKIVTIDTGIGMAEDTIDDLFSPYKRIDEKKSANIQGTGLGMFIVKNLVDKMRGEIVVRSMIDLGTTFTITIPLIKSSTSKIYQRNSEDENKVETEEKKYDFTGKIILSVDDTVINNKIIENILECANATTYCCLDAESCLKLIAMHKVDVILLDHIMPGTDGLECLKKIRNSQEKYKDIPIIMVTGNTSEDDIKTYMENGANDFIAKPVMVEELYKKLDKIFE